MDFILPSSHAHNGRDLLLLLLGIRHPLNWLLASPDIFYETLDHMDESTKKTILFQFKLEVEQYYNENYLTQEWEKRKSIRKILQPNELPTFSNIVGIPGIEWQTLRYENKDKYSKVVIPGFCDSCKSEQPVLVDIIEYLDTVIRAHRPYPSNIVPAVCPRCNKQFGVDCIGYGFALVSYPLGFAEKN